MVCCLSRVFLQPGVLSTFLLNGNRSPIEPKDETGANRLEKGGKTTTVTKSKETVVAVIGVESMHARKFEVQEGAGLTEPSLPQR